MSIIFDIKYGLLCTSILSFREKSSWISFVLILIAALLYFGTVLQIPLRLRNAPVGLFFTAALLIVGAIGITVLEIAAHIVAAIAAPADAMTPIDERDRYVAAKAKGFAFLVLSGVVLVTIAGLLLGMTSWAACQALVLAFVVGELVRYGAEIVYYRYGSLK